MVPEMATTPETGVTLPAFNVTFVVVRLVASSVESVVARIFVSVSGDTVVEPSAGVTDTSVGAGQAASASAWVAAVCDVPFGQVMVTVAGGVADPPPPPPPQEHSNIAIRNSALTFIVLFKRIIFFSLICGLGFDVQQGRGV